MLFRSGQAPNTFENQRGKHQRIFTSWQVCAQPEHLKDDNKFALGFSARDRVDALKQGDKDYERHMAKVDARPTIEEQGD